MTQWLETIKNWFAHSSPKKKVTAGLVLVSLVACVALALTGSDNQASQAVDSPFYFVGVILKLVGVLLLIVGGAVMLVRWQKLPRKNGVSHRLASEESIRLSPKQAIHLVRVGNQHFLIGATDQSVSLIAAVDLPEEESPEEPSRPIPLSLDFSQLLTTLTNKAEQGGRNGTRNG